MGKRSDFKRRKNDAYFTPYEACVPLLAHLSPQVRFCEPCAGDGRMIDHFERNGHICVSAWDIDPKNWRVKQRNALEWRIKNADMYITNPPWTRRLLHDLIISLSDDLPTWLLFDADWMHTVQAVPYLRRCPKIVSVGRVKWIEDSDTSGLDNAAWYLFDGRYSGEPQFFGRDDYATEDSDDE